MNDAKWLDRVWNAYRIYKTIYDSNTQTCEHFLNWLYREYGIVTPDKRKQ